MRTSPQMEEIIAIELPVPIARYLEADRKGDAAGIADCFAPDTVVRENGCFRELILDSGLLFMKYGMRKLKFSVLRSSAVRTNRTCVIATGRIP